MSGQHRTPAPYMVRRRAAAIGYVPAVPEPEAEPAKLDWFSSSPLLVVLRQVRDLGRDRKGTDAELEAVARRAHEALAWFEADSEGRFEAAQAHLDRVYG